MDKLLEGKCAVIAGGGRGIGRAIALEMARHGANVVGTLLKKVLTSRSRIGKLFLGCGNYQRCRYTIDL